MHIPRIYLPTRLTENRTIALSERAFHHVIRVLRLKPGRPLILFNGDGGEFYAVLERVEKNTATVRVEEYFTRNAESCLKITLAQGIATGERMDFCLQKATELGAYKILPLITQHGITHLSNDRLAKRLQHWQGVVISACEQCGRNQVPTILDPVPCLNWLRSFNQKGMALLLDPKGKSRLNELSPPVDAITLLIGPEGGLTPEEISAAKTAGFVGIRLGPRILRTETAGIATLAALQTLWGDLN